MDPLLNVPNRPEINQPSLSDQLMGLNLFTFDLLDNVIKSGHRRQSREEFLQARYIIVAEEDPIIANEIRQGTRPDMYALAKGYFSQELGIVDRVRFEQELLRRCDVNKPEFLITLSFINSAVQFERHAENFFAKNNGATVDLKIIMKLLPYDIEGIELIMHKKISELTQLASLSQYTNDTHELLWAKSRQAFQFYAPIAEAMGLKEFATILYNYGFAADAQEYLAQATTLYEQAKTVGIDSLADNLQRHFGGRDKLTVFGGYKSPGAIAAKLRDGKPVINDVARCRMVVKEEDIDVIPSIRFVIAYMNSLGFDLDNALDAAEVWWQGFKENGKLVGGVTTNPPKNTGYEAIHLVFLSPHGVSTEVQIVTRDRERANSTGKSNHTVYKQSKYNPQSLCALARYPEYRENADIQTRYMALIDAIDQYPARLASSRERGFATPDSFVQMAIALMRSNSIFASLLDPETINTIFLDDEIATENVQDKINSAREQIIKQQINQLKATLGGQKPVLIGGNPIRLTMRTSNLWTLPTVDENGYKELLSKLYAINTGQFGAIGLIGLLKTIWNYYDYSKDYIERQQIDPFKLLEDLGITNERNLYNIYRRSAGHLLNRAILHPDNKSNANMLRLLSIQVMRLVKIIQSSNANDYHVLPQLETWFQTREAWNEFMPGVTKFVDTIAASWLVHIENRTSAQSS
jgi:hypothetical protein